MVSAQYLFKSSVLVADTESRLHAPYYQVTFDVKNTGKVAGSEVSPFYSVSRLHSHKIIFTGTSTVHPSTHVRKLPTKPAPRLRPHRTQTWSNSASDNDIDSLRPVDLGCGPSRMGEDGWADWTDGWSKQQRLQAERGLCINVKLK